MDLQKKIIESAPEPIARKLNEVLSKDDSFEGQLKSLMRVNMAAAKAFRHAASLMTRDHDELLLKTYADQRERFANELRGDLPKSEENEDESLLEGSFADRFVDSLQKGWMSLRAAITEQKLGAVIGEILRDEEDIVTSYDTAIHAAPRNSREHDRLTSQRADIKAVNQTLHRLLDEVKKAAS